MEEVWIFYENIVGGENNGWWVVIMMLMYECVGLVFVL